MRRLFILAALVAPLAFGQGANTIFQQMFLNVTAPAISTVVRNIGQQYHTITLSRTGTCNAAGYVTLEGSYDGTTYFAIGAPIDGPILNVAFTSASGAFAYVRVNYRNTYGVACLVTVSYAGTITGTLTGSAPFVVQQDSFRYGFGTLSSNTGGVFTVVATCPSVSLAQLYSLVVEPVGGANLATLTYLDSVLGTIWTHRIPMAATGSFILPQGSRPYFAIQPAVPVFGSPEIRMSISNATTVDFFSTWRCE